MTALELILLRGGFAPRQLGLPDDVLDPAAPAGIPCKARIDTVGFAGRSKDWPLPKTAYRVAVDRRYTKGGNRNVR